MAETGDRDARDPGLSDGSLYYVLAVSDEHFRVVDDLGRPVLYAKVFFEPVDGSIPAGWQFRDHDEGAYELDPIDCGAPGFYEDLFNSDGDRAAEARAQSILEDTLARAIEGDPGAYREVIERDLARFRGWSCSRRSRPALPK